MRTRGVVSFLFWLFIIMTAIPSVASGFTPGQYQIISTIEMPGMPAGSIPAQTIVQCMTEQDPIPKTNDASQDCTISNMKQSTNTITWEMECTQQGQKMKSHGQMTFSNDTFKGTNIMQMGPESGNMNVINNLSGTRLGECTGK